MTWFPITQPTVVWTPWSSPFPEPWVPKPTDIPQIAFQRNAFQLDAFQTEGRNAWVPITTPNP